MGVHDLTVSDKVYMMRRRENETKDIYGAEQDLFDPHAAQHGIYSDRFRAIFF